MNGAHILLQRREHQDEETVGTRRSMAASRSSRVTRSSVGLNGLDENFCGRTLRNRSIAQPEDTSVSPLPRARSPKKKQDGKQESKQDTKQDVKQDVKQDSQQDTKHEAKQDAQQDGQQQALLQEKLSDSNASPAEAEQWNSTRKRSVSCLEKDISPEKSENCDRGKGSRDACSQIKRAKRCSRSAESQGHDEDSEPLTSDSPVSVPEPSKDNSCEDFPSQNSSPASPVHIQEKDEPTEGKAEDGHEECDGATRPPNAHKASNGLKKNKAEEPSALTEESSATPPSVSNTPLLLNGSQTAAPSPPHPAVPCRNSVPLQVEVSGSGESPASPAPTFVPMDPEQVIETENDTNGRPLTPLQEATASTSSTNMNISPINNNSNSGETTPPLATTPSPTEPGYNPSVSSTPPSFTELYEHRYTLRTSPRRAASSSKLSSPPRDNGPVSCERPVSMAEDIVAVVAKEEDQSREWYWGPAGGNGTPGFSSDTWRESRERRSCAKSSSLPRVREESYQRLLQTIGVLEAQRTQAILDLETLARQQREALADPISFVEHLQKRVNLGLPRPQRVVQLPDIGWDQYTSGLSDFEREFCDKKRKTRRLKLIFDQGLPARPNSPVEPKKEGESSSMYSSLPTSDALENSRQAQLIRGRISQPNKSDTFNQLWTVEEQKKLEQLLLKFPPEEVESRRWQKVADELGNRTAKQVASRVQKYFIKLTKAGIPVPGRTPNLCMYTKKASSKRQHHLNKHLYRPSTFLASYEPPVYMDEEDERAAYYGSVQDASADDSDEETIPVELRNLPEYKELLELKRLKKQTLQEIHEDKDEMLHVGFKCDVCGMDPIQGVRWHCQDCPQDNSVDFCSNCSDCLFKTETHKPNHHLEPVHQQDSFLDRDYCLPQSAGYNYLDPNYFPANR
ncbi:hypothetical protein JOQ06_001780 [Pogonophryne albipinna]|uniref:ZZ-type zinc finger-containing protein 3 n=1 Tax=Pogonophryne albipinna TaxID=1090488 RepID=A0AAD6B3D3_9TELE|nr:hypothetical protein JOQ06_001780 [Pogonophryne albipinna]